MAKIIWTDFAIEDLKSIHDYISRDSKSYANKFIDKLISKVEQLETFPQSGKVVPEFGKEDIRELVEGNYRIIYKIRTGHIGVVRVHHSAQLLNRI